MLGDQEIRQLYTEVIVKNSAQLAAIQILMDRGKVMPLADSRALMEKSIEAARDQYSKMPLGKLMITALELIRHD